MSEKHGKRYTPRFKFQVVREILSGTKAIGQIARSYGVRPVTLTHWKKEFIVGYALGKADNTELALAAWRRAKKTLESYGVKTEGIIVHHDQDGVYLGHGWLYELAVRDKVLK
jgi:transposase-like protein